MLCCIPRSFNSVQWEDSHALRALSLLFLYTPLIPGCLVGVFGIYILSPLTWFPMLPSWVYLGIYEQQILINTLHVGRGKPVERPQPSCFPSRGLAWAACAPANCPGKYLYIVWQRKSHRDDGQVSFYLLRIQPVKSLGRPEALQDSLVQSQTRLSNFTISLSLKVATKLKDTCSLEEKLWQTWTAY